MNDQTSAIDWVGANKWYVILVEAEISNTVLIGLQVSKVTDMSDLSLSVAMVHVEWIVVGT